MKVRWKTVAAWLMSLVGLSSCIEGIINTPDMYGTPPPMYGTPYAAYDVSINVMDEDKNPIPGIVLPYGGDSLVSDENGNISFKADEIFQFRLEDVDGPENGGEFEPKTVDYEDFSIVKVEDGDGSWFKGSFKADADVVMKKVDGGEE